ncbi:MAG: hypothetical protein IBX69_16225 [Anaerolineales bacterium]|nr:hypothetical protein [Anaerolineales bacterium]
MLQRGSETKRFTIHEILRQLAKERLQSLGIAGAFQEAHSRYFLGYLAKAEVDLRGKWQLDALDEIQAALTRGETLDIRSVTARFESMLT